MVKPDFVIGSWLVLLLSEQFMVLALSEELFFVVALVLRDSRYIVFPIPVPLFVFSGTRSS